LRYSIIRRSSGFTVLFLVGHAFNYALFWGANRVLDNASFGLFYTAMLTINIMMAPVTAVTLVLAKRFAELGAKENRDQVVALTRHILGWCLRAGPVVVTAGIAFAVAARWFGIEAWQAIVLIPITVLILAAVEILRASLQGMLLFARASALWVASTGVSCTFAFGALLLSMKVWAAIAGLLFGSALVAGVVCLTWYPRPRHQAPQTSPIVELDLKYALPMIGSYSLFILFNNSDVLIAYFLLQPRELDIYAASALLPKAIITATFAIAQVVLPVITEQRSSGTSFRSSAGKGLGLVVLVATVAGACLWIAAPILQHSPLAIRGLEYGVMNTLAIGATAMSILRVLVVIEVALQRYAVGFGQAGALGLFTLLCLNLRGGPIGIAKLYTATTIAFVLLSCVLFIVTWTAARRGFAKAR
jgi:O-antigen/teichoic acid export membrane protein